MGRELPRLVARVAAIERCQASPLRPLKVNVVVMRGSNDAELVALIPGTWARKGAGQLINSPDIVRPERTMSTIGC